MKTESPLFQKGYIFITHYGLECEIIDIIDKKFIIQFKESGNVQITAYRNIYAKVVRDYSVDKIYGIGYAYGTISKPLSTTEEAYKQWFAIMYRCYRSKLKWYQDVSVCEEWHNYNCFEEWYNQNVKILRENNPGRITDFCIDKDLFSEFGHKVYSPETCCLLPRSLNSTFRKIGWENGEIIGMTQKKYNSILSLIEQYRPLLSLRVISQIEKIMNTCGLEQATNKKKIINVRAKIWLNETLYEASSLKELKKLIKNIEKKV